jgi:Flp pilus assembly protein TadD
MGRHGILISIALVVLTIGVFSRACRNDFVNYDDPEYVTRNPFVRQGLTPQSIGWAFTAVQASNWHPLTWLSLELDAQLYGLAPWGFHLTNVLLHAANTLLLFLALRALTGCLVPSAFVAALFAVHPLHVESVAWVAERKDVLSGLFWMLTLLSYACYRAAPTWTRYSIVAACFAAGLLAKPMLVTLPFVLLLLDYWPTGVAIRDQKKAEPRSGTTRVTSERSVSTHWLWQSRGFTPPARRWSLVIEKIPLIVLAIGSSGITLYAQNQGGAVVASHQLPLDVRVSNAALAYCAYMTQALCPVTTTSPPYYLSAPFGAFYPHPAHEWMLNNGFDIPIATVGGAVILLLGVSFIAIVKRKVVPYLFTGWFWYLGTLVPVIGIVQVGSQARADRYTYIPLIGLFLVLVWAAKDIASRWQRQRLIAYAGLVPIGLLAYLSWQQVGFWSNSLSLWRHTLDVCGESGTAHANLGEALKERAEAIHSSEDIREAALHFTNALRFDEYNPSAHYQLAEILASEGKHAEAAQHWQAAVSLVPQWVLARYNFGVTLTVLGRVPEAIHQYEQAVQLYPELAEAHENLGLLLVSIGRKNEGEHHLQLARQLKSGAGRTQ